MRDMLEKNMADSLIKIEESINNTLVHQIRDLDTRVIGHDEELRDLKAWRVEYEGKSGNN